ncbi:hypothetical protein PVK06_011145 [Gossypium arboreum]|uniref:Aminotransferase-like plant mobile domain-containing protein n=1 Tax=Gossypium arboreum TaxID=29729 RepID=A0ABR0Q8B0_GOSAR|nr:hypothetical protein PVK06_011145 [Gossypium arboreum]
MEGAHHSTSKFGFFNATLAQHWKKILALVAMLVECWRLETHTFHFSCGECTITLEDLALQLGLLTDGRPVIGNDVVRCNIYEICEEYLGIALES